MWANWGGLRVLLISDIGATMASFISIMGSWSCFCRKLSIDDGDLPVTNGNVWPCKYTKVSNILYVCMYICMYVCMDVWMYGCMDVWMYGCMDGWMDGWMYGCMDVWMYGCMHVWMYACMHVYMYACMHVCMHACMYVCMCIYIYIYLTYQSNETKLWFHCKKSQVLDLSTLLIAHV